MHPEPSACNAESFHCIGYRRSRLHCLIAQAVSGCGPLCRTWQFCCRRFRAISPTAISTVLRLGTHFPTEGWHLRDRKVRYVLV
jgi:hypothetical protein